MRRDRSIAPDFAALLTDRGLWAPISRFARRHRNYFGCSSTFTTAWRPDRGPPARRLATLGAA